MERCSDLVVKTLLMSDLVGSTHLAEQLGDSRASTLFARYESLSRDLLVTCDGWEIDKADGFLLLFDHAYSAVRYALAYHETLARLAREEGIRLEARVGIHQGKVMLRRNPPEHIARGAKPLEVEGLSKPTTARLMRLASPRQTLLTLRALRSVLETVAEEQEPIHPHLQWRAHGRYQLQGLRKSVPVFEIGLSGQSPMCPPRDITKVQSAERERTIPMLGL